MKQIDYEDIFDRFRGPHDRLWMKYQFPDRVEKRREGDWEYFVRFGFYDNVEYELTWFDFNLEFSPFWLPTMLDWDYDYENLICTEEAKKIVDAIKKKKLEV